MPLRLGTTMIIAHTLTATQGAPSQKETGIQWLAWTPVSFHDNLSRTLPRGRLAYTPAIHVCAQSGFPWYSPVRLFRNFTMSAASASETPSSVWYFPIVFTASVRSLVEASWK